MTTPSRAATAPSAAQSASPAREAATAGVPSTALTGTNAPTQMAANSARSVSPQARPSVNVYSGLNKLLAITAATCVLNGAAAYTYVTSGANQLASVVAAQQVSLEEVTRIIDTMPTTAKSLTSAEEQAYLTNIGAGAARLSEAATRAASGPAALADDAARFTAVSASYAKYVGTVERARASTGTTSTSLYRQADTIRRNEIDPVLSGLNDRYADRSDRAEMDAMLTGGFLGLTTLLSLGSLLVGSVWLARATKRFVNPGLVGAALLAGGTSYMAAISGVNAPVALPTAVLGPLVLVTGIGSAGLAWAGVQQRRKEYR